MKLLRLDSIRLKGLLAHKQIHAAKAIKVSPNTLYKKLTGEHRFYLDELNNIAHFLGVDTMDFLNEVEDGSE